jgi:predicted nucleic acid-binding protein
MPKPLVVDASVAFRLILPGPQQDHYRSLMTQWVRDRYQLLAPTLWVYEMTSALCQAVRFGELSLEEGQRASGLAQGLGIELMHPDDNQVRLACEWTVSLNRAAAYDSFYLALAETLGCELWTADKRLARAVDRPWVHWAGT